MHTIIQISDLHIPAKEELVYGVNIRRNVAILLAALRSTPHELLVITGDLALDVGNHDSYSWLKKELAQWPASIVCIPGNHDDDQLMREYFFSPNLPYQFLFDSGIQIGFIDTHRGTILEDQLEWLKAELSSASQFPHVFFMHYPPVYGGVPHMDTNHFLQNRKAFQDLIDSSQKEVTVFCGHYHVQKVIHRPLLTVAISPSPYFTIDEEQESFATKNAPLCYRRIQLSSDQLMWQDVVLRE